jgi:hypothetical protein
VKTDSRAMPTALHVEEKLELFIKYEGGDRRSYPVRVATSIKVWGLNLLEA